MIKLFPESGRVWRMGHSHSLVEAVQASITFLEDSLGIHTHTHIKSMYFESCEKYMFTMILYTK